MEEPPLQSLFTLLLILFLIIMAAFFSAAEIAFTSLNRVRVRNKAENGSKRAALVLRLYDKYDELISTILVSSNIAYLSAASASALWFIRYYGDIGATVSSVVMTLTLIFFSEITPKSLAKEYPETFALFSAPLVYALMLFFTPVNAIFIKWKKFLGRVIKTTPDDQTITEEELFTIVEEAEQNGAIDEEDMQLIHNALEFGDLRADDIFTPRMQIVGMTKAMSTDDIANLFLETGYSRIPVYDETIDNIVGMVHLRDFFEHMLKKEKPLEDIITPAVFVAPSIFVNDLLKKLQKEKSHIAVITDEYGGTMGIVTMEDILEELVGDIWDESDEIIEEFVPLEDGTVKVICTADIDRVFEYFNLEFPEDVEASTVSGWIMDTLGKIPEEGDNFTYKNLTVTVHKVEGRRVLECLVSVEREEVTDF
jgi:CBS domain containing-hemolysin-like protein